MHKNNSKNCGKCKGGRSPKLFYKLAGKHFADVIHEILDNATGCNSPEEVQDSCEANAVMIDEQYIINNLALYPNPANQELNLSIEGLTIDEVVVYSLTGQQVYAFRPESETIDISTLPPGMYIVEVTVEGRKVGQKIMVQR